MKRKIIYFLFALFVFSVMSPVYAKEELLIEKINEVTIDNDGFWMAPFANTYKTDNGGYVVAQETYVTYLDKNSNVVWDYYVGDIPGGSYDILLDGSYVYVTIGQECQTLNQSDEEVMPSDKIDHEPIAGHVEEKKEAGKAKEKPKDGDTQTESMFRTVKIRLSDGSVVKTNNEVGGIRIEKAGSYYAVGVGTYVLLLDSGLNVVKEYNTNACIGNLMVYKDQISVMNDDYKIRVFDSQLNLISTKSITGYDWNPSYRNSRTIFTDGTNHYLVNFDIGKFNQYGYYTTEVVGSEGSGDEIIGTNYDYFSGDIFGNYVFVAGYSYDYDGSNWTNPTAIVKVFDKEFNLVQTVVVGTDSEWLNVKNLSKTSTGFTVKWISDSDGLLHVSDYSVKYNITTKVQGEGTIEVIGSAFAGDSVKFKVTPKPGYLVYRVTVTDTDGNSVIYEDVDSDYLFTMPNSDCVVSVQFLKNPVTASNVTIAIFIVALISGITIFIRKKNKVNA